jgi:hypothetical protein
MLLKIARPRRRLVLALGVNDGDDPGRERVADALPSSPLPPVTTATVP